MSFLNWQWNNCCVTNAIGSQILTYYTKSGWQLVSHNFSQGASCLGGGFAESTAEFFNGVFCPNLTHDPKNTTAIDYYSTDFFGYSSGDSNYSWLVTPSGGCTILLKFGFSTAHACVDGNGH
ncbi:MAG TPA: hypothetical protein VMT32_04645 [Bryobacteraceae bacterium]|nr:hypothetical protein [Bryobacteraceae bacterium]